MRARTEGFEFERLSTMTGRHPAAQSATQVWEPM